MAWDTQTADARKPQNCEYCGSLHERTICPLIKAIEYHPNGTVKRVEFHAPAPFVHAYMPNFVVGSP